MHNVSYTYPGGVQAVQNLDIEIRSGEVMSLIGPSGCGKSTMISIVSGLREASGTIEWNQKYVDAANALNQRLVNVVFQRDTVMPWLSVEKNISFGLRYLPLPKKEKALRIDRLLKMGGLEDFRHSRPHQLSGGMRRRVALLTGIAPQPKLLILDEPFSALDEPTRIGIHADLLDMAHELDMSILLVTHDLSEAVSLSDQVVVFTKRPGTVASLVDVPLGRDRDVHHIRSTDTYQLIYRDLWDKLWDQIGTTA
ncbi:ABC transporter ATP-binding protein [Rhodococcus sp. USK10]|uniref:ABC transporter ATP-binding protein n=1 Tax=Rhodococcus sp. USK10 TaxID=2789739 RepID=UPI002150817C|nr:ATP-binding cassette domain-containing protein [Rhodococcus sp. USK10]